MSTDALLEIRNLDVTYWDRSLLGLKGKGFQAVKGANLSIRPGETLGLVGESGSGKSSIANTVLGLVPATGGEIRFGDVDLASMRTNYPSSVRKEIQAVFQDPYSSLNPSMTVEDIVTEPLRVHTTMTKGERRTRALELLKLVSLSEEHLARHPHQFSGGQRQRIAIARALMMEPEVIVADEPVSALDVSVQAQVLDLLAEIQERRNLAVLFITHDLRVAAQICDEVMVMQRGRVVENGPAAEVLANPRHEYTQALINAAPGRDWDFAAGHRIAGADA